MLPFTDIEGALKISENIRLIIEAQKIEIYKGKMIKFTISLGVGNVDTKNDTEISAAIDRSDIALYEAKTTGRNKVVVYSR